MIKNSFIYRGCGNHGCILNKPTGQATNGRCFCRQRIENLVKEISIMKDCGMCGAIGCTYCVPEAF